MFLHKTLDRLFINACYKNLEYKLFDGQHKILAKKKLTHKMEF